MEKKIVKKCIGLIGIVVLVVFYRLLVPQEDTPEYVFLYAENQTSDYPTTEGAKEFARLVEERTNGRIRILVKAEGELGTEKEVIKQMKYGGIDFARVSISQLAELLPKLSVLQLPFLYEDSAHMWSVLDGEIGEELLQISDECELVGLSWYDAGARNFYTTGTPIRCLEDMQGLNIRVQESQMMEDMVEALGANAIQLGYDDVYSYIEKGIVDGAENNWPSYEAMQHYEVAAYYCVDEHTRVPEMQLCSLHTWNKLSDEDKEIIRQCAKESAQYERNLWKEREEQSRENALAKGVCMSELSYGEKQRFRAAMADVYKKYSGEYIDIVQEIIKLQN